MHLGAGAACAWGEGGKLGPMHEPWWRALETHSGQLGLLYSPFMMMSCTSWKGRPDRRFWSLSGMVLAEERDEAELKRL